MTQVQYPFSAIVGQNLLKKALILNAVDPSIGGLLIRGERGTAKSTAVRSIAAILPKNSEMSHTEKAKVKKMRVVELPLSATEDKVVGSINISKAMKYGEKIFEPGILAHANGNILYIDEVNLLNDHIVDVLLDSAAMGVNTVEREGISFSHPSRFILVGTMNPEEGDLRPQLLDRFGLCVNVEGLHDAKSRMEILKRRSEFDADSHAFMEKWVEKDNELTRRIIKAKDSIKDISISDEIMKLAVDICIDARAEGCRGDAITIKTAKALASYNGRTFVTEEDVREAAILSLAHRSRDPPKSSPSLDSNNDQDNEKNEGEQNDHESSKGDLQSSSDNEPSNETDDSSDFTGTTEFSMGEEFTIKRSALDMDLRIDNIIRNLSGKRSETESEQGRYTGYRIPNGKPTSIAFDATFRAAAIHQKERYGTNALKIEEDDIREKIKEKKIGDLIVFLVDASGSMGTQQRMTTVKGAIASLLTDAYQKRDRVSLITFRADSAEVIVEPTNSIDLARSRMNHIPTGGKTPLIHGLAKSDELIRRELKRDSKIRPILIILSDGRGNVPMFGKNFSEEIMTMSAIMGDYQKMIIDTETGLIKLGFAEKLSSTLDAKYIKLEDLKS